MTTVVLSGETSDEFIECTRRNLKITGKLFKKQIFRWGEFSNPNNPNFKIKVDRPFFESMKRNFDTGVCPIVQVPLATHNNSHTEAPDMNLGEVVDLTSDDQGIYALIDFRKHADDVGSTLLGASAKLALNYTDRRTNTPVGPTLLHLCVTNRPYLTDLSDYETISASDADTTDEVVLLTDAGSDSNSTEENIPMTKEELIIALSEHGIDVEAGQAALAQVEGFVALSDVIGEGAEITPEQVSQTIVDLTASVADRDTRVLELTNQLQEVQKGKATDEVDSLITKGRILPAWREDMIELSMTDRPRFETFLLPEDLATAELSEQGYTTSQSTQEEDPSARARAEGERLAKLTK